MFRSFSSRLPQLSSAVTSSSSYAARQMSANVQSPARPINRRLEVDLQELDTMQYMDNLTLIDVRQPAELQLQKQIPGSIHIPLGALRGAFQLSTDDWQIKYGVPKPAKTDKAIVFYARGPIASSAAVEIAHRLGYKKSRHYVGGWEDYCAQNNMPVITPKQTEDPLKEHYNYHYYNPDLHYL